MFCIAIKYTVYVELGVGGWGMGLLGQACNACEQRDGTDGRMQEERFADIGLLQPIVF